MTKKLPKSRSRFWLEHPRFALVAALVGSAAIIVVFIGGAALYEQGIHGQLWETILFWGGIGLLILSVIWSRDIEARIQKRNDKRDRKSKHLR